MIMRCECQCCGADCGEQYCPSCSADIHTRIIRYSVISAIAGLVLISGLLAVTKFTIENYHQIYSQEQLALK